MKTNVNLNDFADRFLQSDNYKNNFTYNWLKALYDYLEQYEEATGSEIEFDMIALCCEYTEYENLAELQGNYSDIESFNDLENNTSVIYIWKYQDENSPFIIQNY